MISICSHHCNCSMKRQRFYCFIYFAQNADIQMSGKWRNSTIDQKWEVNCLYNGQLSTSRCIKNVIIFQQHFLSSTSRTKDQSNYCRKSGKLSDPVQTRSDKHACGKPMLTDHGKQATRNREPANEMNKEDPTQGILVWLQPFKNNQPGGPGGACARTFHWKSELRFGRWGFKSGDTKDGSIVFMLTSAKTKRDLFCEQKTMVIWQQQSKNIFCEGCESRNNHRYAVVVPVLATIRDKPRLHKRRRRIYESSCSRHRSQKLELFIPDNLLEFGKYCEEWSWDHQSSTLHRSETNGIAEWAARRKTKRDISRIIAIWIGW